MSSLTKTILGAVGAVLVLGAIYMLFFNKSSTPASDSAVSVSGAPSSEAEQTFVTLIGKIGPIVFDTSIFNDPRFSALIDIHTPITSEQTGRKDPFAPVAGITSTASGQ